MSKETETPPSQQQIIDGLANENQALHHLLADSEKRVVSLLANFMSLSEEMTKMPVPIILINILYAGDPRLDTLDKEIPIEWEERVKAFRDEMVKANGTDRVQSVASIVRHYDKQTQKKALH